MAAGDPTGADLCSGTTDGDTLPDWTSGYEEREISFGAGVELTSGEKYAIIIRAPDAAGNPNDSDVVWPVENPGSYGGGDVYASADSGSSWTSQNYDTWFKTKAGAVVKDSHLPSNGLSFDDAFGVGWLAQTFVASSTYTITSVVLKLEAYQFDTTGTVTVSIRATDLGLPGAPTNPSPSDSVDPNITLDETPLSWDASDPVADTYEIYCSIQGDDWETVPVGIAQAGVEWAIDFGVLDYGTTYEWRIDATNIYGTTTGDTWSFTTISFDRILISYVLIPTGRGVGYGPYDDPPGIEGADWSWTGENTMLAVRRLVVAIDNKIWYEVV